MRLEREWEMRREELELRKQELKQEQEEKEKQCQHERDQPGAADSPCPQSWIPHGDSCYSYFAHQQSWAEAEAECQSSGHGAHLSSMLSAAEGGFVAGYLGQFPRAGDVWIGLSDPEQPDLFPISAERRLGLDSELLPQLRSLVQRGAPNAQTQEPCAELSSGTGFLKWKAEPCDVQTSFICKYQRQPGE
ncbi:regenerating islet-derived protein 4-like [Emys orbicularis]|uniref:regenerating islet-derived protein 4-like n=1 Tax=Emys orbicularis TaxID=82168 RepID=UPI0031FD660F